MFISQHQQKTNLCRFCYLISEIIFFFVIPLVCWTVRVFHFLNLGSVKRISASLFTFRDFRHRSTMILKVERTLKHAKTAERNSTRCECIFHQLAVKNVNVNVVKMIYCQHNSIFLRQKNYSIHYLTSQNWSLSGLKNIWTVIMTGDLLSVIFSPDDWNIAITWHKTSGPLWKHKISFSLRFYDIFSIYNVIQTSCFFFPEKSKQPLWAK